MTNLLAGGGTNVFNARDLKAREVAQRFVAPAAFKTLLGDYNCVLEGPRGSGKTTLLRMLTPEAFALWRELEESASINFVGVFIPADVRWAKQLEARLTGLQDMPKRMFMGAAFSVATSLALVETLESCSENASRFQERFPELFFKIDRAKESELVSELAEIWKIEIKVPSFSGMKLALRVRQHRVGLLAALASCGESLHELLLRNPFLASSWLENLTTAVESINEGISRPEQRWAILLDELEIVPKEVLSCIIEALRSTSPLIKFKLALSPTGTDLMFAGDSTAPTPENDYRPIPLWYEKRKDARVFAERLFIRAMEQHGSIEPKDLSRLLGPNWIGGISDEDDSMAEPVSDSAKRQRIEAFVSLYKKDESFKSVLDKRDIDPNDPPLSDESVSGTFVRKITPLVCLRDREIERFTTSEEAIRKGGRKGSDPYTGYPNLLDLAEGNPRWVLTLADLIQSHTNLSEQDFRSQGVQSAVVRDYTEQFVSKLTVYPTGNASHGKRWTLMKFVDSLGGALADTLFRKAFSSDPALSFSIDGRALSQYEDYIRLCIDLGALVLLRGGTAAPLGEASGGTSLEGARVRISYRLAPRFRLPLRATKERTLSGAIRAGILLGNANLQHSPETDVQSSDVDMTVQQRLI